MEESLRNQVAALLGHEVTRHRRLHGGMIAEVSLVELTNGERVVVKSSAGTPLSVEASMLLFLRRFTELPVPTVLASGDDVLVLEYLEGGSAFDEAAERHAAELLAALHSTGPARIQVKEVEGRSASTTASGGNRVPKSVSSDLEPLSASPRKEAGASESVCGVGQAESEDYGFYFDTLIGPFEQKNDWSAVWPDFFRSNRIEPMLEACQERGTLPPRTEDRVVAATERFDELLGHQPLAGLIHGDIWSGNVLSERGRIIGLIDPAIYFADPEVELAFIDLFGTFGAVFWEHYRELRKVDERYWEFRRDLYQLYPLLVHVALFGRGYLEGLEVRLKRLERI